jgi:uncharacterized protein YndB with AHSA1/START domain
MPKSMVLEATMPHPPSQVFAVLTDLGQAAEWHHGVQEIKPLTEGSFAVGTSWLERRVGPDGREFASTITVTALDRPRALGLHVDHKMLRMDLRFDLTPDGFGTRVRYVGALTGKGLGKLFSGKMLKMMKKVDGDLLDRLSAQAAKQQPKPSPSKAAPTGRPKPKAAGKAKPKKGK